MAVMLKVLFAERADTRMQQTMGWHQPHFYDSVTVS